MSDNRVKIQKAPVKADEQGSKLLTMQKGIDQESIER